ncbi:MAG: hypothetical protein KDA53_03720 [Hyphomonas sp.]|nr:hypothetical protein [Hyphomonas sp.]
MKRAHRTAHRSIWIIAAPLLVCVLIAALACRQETPLNDTLPGVAVAEAH